MSGLGGFKYLILGVLSFLLVLWLARILVSGSYYSLWDLLWYGRPFPGPLPIAAFLAGMAVLSRYPRAMKPMMAAPASVILLGDDVRLLSIPAGLGLAASLWAAQRYSGFLPQSIAGALSVDLLLRVAGRGVDPVEYAWGAAILALSSALLAAYSEGGSPPRLGMVGGVIMYQLGIAYPSGVTSLAGITDYGLLEYSLLGLAVSSFSLLGAALVGRRATLLALLAPAGAVVGGWLGALAMAASSAGATAAVRAGRMAPLASGVLFVAVMVAGVAVYAYPYIGLYPLADNMEVVLATAALLVAAGRPAGPPRTTLRCLLLLSPAVLAVAASPMLSQEPVEAGGPGSVITVASYNLHQGFDWRGRLNGAETSREIARLASIGAYLCLQEFEAGRLTSAYTDMVVALKSRGVDVVFSPAIEGAYGVAIAGASVEASSQRLLTSLGEQRAAVKALAGGVAIVNAHLGLDPIERAVQARELVEMALSKPRALIICGDFNEEDGEAIDYISVYYQLSRPEPYTCCLGSETRVVIDYVGVRRGEGEIVEARVVEASSDHLIVIAEIAVSP